MQRHLTVKIANFVFLHSFSLTVQAPQHIHHWFLKLKEVHHGFSFKRRFIQITNLRRKTVPDFSSKTCERSHGLTVFIRLTALALIKFLDLESGHLFEVGAYSRLGAY